MTNFNEVVRQLQRERERAARQLEKLNLAIKALSSVGVGTMGSVRRKPRFSAAAKARIAAAQRARWAKIKAAQKK